MHGSRQELHKLFCSKCVENLPPQDTRRNVVLTTVLYQNNFHNGVELSGAKCLTFTIGIFFFFFFNRGVLPMAVPFFHSDLIIP